MYSLMLCISSSDSSPDHFPSQVSVEKALENGALVGPHAVKHANTRAAAKLWFPFKPSGIDIWVSLVMDMLDGCFVVSLVDPKTGDLFPDFGDTATGSQHHEHWKDYGRQVIAKFDAYFEQHATEDNIQKSFMARLTWFLSTEASDYHHFLPFPSPTCLELVGKQLRKCDYGLVEVRTTFALYALR